jgi:hypothetical protein
MSACPYVHLVDRHFALRIRPAQERRLRAHLADCDVCREHYGRLLLLARLDPCAPSPLDRLARGLGLRGAPPRGRWLTLAVAALAAASALALWPRPAQEEGFTSRGAPASLPSVIVYRVRASGEALAAGSFIAATDELAFAYRNPGGRRFLLIFATDELRHVYWYYPSWTDAAQDPAAVPVRQTLQLVELPEAVAHRIAGGKLVVHALLVDRPIGVREIEARLARGATPLIDGADENQLALEVRR